MHEPLMLVAESCDRAQFHDDVVVVFKRSDSFGWGAHVHAVDDSTCMLRFPWTDFVDQVLGNDDSDELPWRLGRDDSWSDGDESWEGEVISYAGMVFVAMSFDDPCVMIDNPDGRGGHSSDAYPMVEPHPAHTRGRVLVNGADVRVSSVPWAAWHRAWADARAACLTGNPSPTLPDESTCAL